MFLDHESLTYGDMKKIAALVSAGTTSAVTVPIGKKVIIRTCTAGVWFGTLAEKSGSEVILNEARRMWSWKAAKSISLSACAKYGIDQNSSKIVEAVDSVWLEAIEIIPCTTEAIASIGGAPDVKAN